MRFNHCRKLGAPALAMLLACASFPALPQDVPTLPEQFYQLRFCAGLDTKIRLGRPQRADCLSQTHAIEIEWHDEWKEAIGRTLAHAAGAALQPGLVLICRSDQGHCLKASLLARETLSHHRVEGTLWDCLPIHKTLADCTRWEL